MPNIKFASNIAPLGKYEFHSKENYENWYKNLTAYLAELDEYMNYCTYFKREKGDNGYYEREGKRYPVKGYWKGIQDFDDVAKDFAIWLEENGWRKMWFELREKYQEHKQLAYNEPKKIKDEV